MRVQFIPIRFVKKEKKIPRPGERIGGRGRRALRDRLCARATQRTARLKRGKRKSEQSPDENERRRRKEVTDDGEGGIGEEEGRKIVVELGRGGDGDCAVGSREEGRTTCM